MKPPSFDYVAARSLDEAVERLAEHGDSAKVLAGGQSLVPMLNLRLAGPEVLVDINGVQEIGHPAIRHRGTVGGSLAHADPAAELPAAMLALEATLIARGPRGVRSLPVADFFSGYLSTVLEPDELLTDIHGSAVYRSKMAVVMVRRAVELAAQRAGA
jgi:carbon-monoxide dehydrogenase medium subunit